MEKQPVFSIIDKQTAMHYLWGANCDAWVLTGKPELSVKLEKMPKETKETRHFHKQAQQLFYIISGTAIFYIQEEKQIVLSQQSILIEPLIRHCIANESEEALEFMVVSQPSADKDRYE
ncbi:MAG: cupin domain-containing protein [Chitinophagaceae bacterium]